MVDNNFEAINSIADELQKEGAKITKEFNFFSSTKTLILTVDNNIKDILNQILYNGLQIDIAFAQLWELFLILMNKVRGFSNDNNRGLYLYYLKFITHFVIFTIFGPNSYKHIVDEQFKNYSSPLTKFLFNEYFPNLKNEHISYKFENNTRKAILNCKILNDGYENGINVIIADYICSQYELFLETVCFIIGGAICGDQIHKKMFFELTCEYCTKTKHHTTIPIAKLLTSNKFIHISSFNKNNINRINAFIYKSNELGLFRIRGMLNLNHTTNELIGIYFNEHSNYAWYLNAHKCIQLLRYLYNGNENKVTETMEICLNYYKTKNSASGFYFFYSKPRYTLGGHDYHIDSNDFYCKMDKNFDFLFCEIIPKYYKNNKTAMEILCHQMTCSIFSYYLGRNRYVESIQQLQNKLIDRLLYFLSLHFYETNWFKNYQAEFIAVWAAYAQTESRPLLLKLVNFWQNTNTNKRKISQTDNNIEHQHIIKRRKLN